MTKGARFVFDSYSADWDAGAISFLYRTEFATGESERYTETLQLPQLQRADVPESVLNRLLETVHLMLGISYYKQYCPEYIDHQYTLSHEDARFWETVYVKGLGEFAYRNNLNLNGKIHFAFSETNTRPISFVRSPQVLAGVGGGKESAVTIELLKEEGFTPTGFIVETHVTQEKAATMCAIAGIDTLVARRVLDPLLLTKRPGVYNGHVPVSAIYAAIGVLCAALYDFSYVTVGNEASSNFGNVEHDGFEVNHQWSKSSEFESLFRSYTRSIFTDDIVYFSLLRPFHEIRIAKLFAEYPHYFSSFASCNKNFVINPDDRPKGNWCGTCAKCAFVFLMLSPWMERKTLEAIFGKNLLDDPALIPLYTDLIGNGSMKPFDCVGSFDEARTAFTLVEEVYRDTAVVRALRGSYSIPKETADTVLRTHSAPLVPTPFVFCGMRSIAILGYGKEGVASETYMSALYPKKKIRIFDDAHGEPLEYASSCDCAIRSPGIQRKKVATQSTTATNLFFERYRKTHTIVGVTGSKGKSTTASLIAHLLTSSGKSCVLLGNVGTPMLSVDPIPQDTIIVLELSSYQLEDAQRAPNIAVVTSLFPDHIPYHGSIDAYYAAKRSIIERQRPDDKVFFAPQVGELPEWRNGVIGSFSITSQTIPIKMSETKLIGAHNESNMALALSVATELGVEEKGALTALKTFNGLTHRLQNIGTHRGITFYDDAIATTPEATIAALRALGSVETVFLGGDDRGYDFSELERLLPQFGVKHVVLFPDSGNRIVIDSSITNVFKTSTMKDAVAFAYEHTTPGGICLLSCASPSYSLWKNFEEKGAEFTKEVNDQA